MSFLAASEARIIEAMAQGKFRQLKGEGQPLRITEAEQLAGEDWLGNHLMEAADALPEWLLLGKDIERQEGVVARRRQIYDHLLARCQEDGDWDRFAAAIADTVDRFTAEATELRRQQERFNYTAPGPHTQRPAFWITYHLAQMAAAATAAGAPDDVVASFRKAG